MRKFSNRLGRHPTVIIGKGDPIGSDQIGLNSAGRAGAAKKAAKKVAKKRRQCELVVEVVIGVHCGEQRMSEERVKKE